MRVCVGGVGGEREEERETRQLVDYSFFLTGGKKGKRREKEEEEAGAYLNAAGGVLFHCVSLRLFLVYARPQARGTSYALCCSERKVVCSRHKNTLCSSARHRVC